jgi:putative ABC transport system substrate-binding protein
VHVRRRFLIAAGAWAALANTCALPQSARRIGMLFSSTSEVGKSSLDAFSAGLKDSGYLDGRKIVIDKRWVASDARRAIALARELFALQPAVIIAGGPGSTLALKRTATKVPVVFVSVADPIALGLTRSLARPDGSFTGLATTVPESFFEKQLELLRDAAPRVVRLALLHKPHDPMHVRYHNRTLQLAEEPASCPSRCRSRQGRKSRLRFARRRRAMRTPCTSLEIPSRCRIGR